MRTVLRQVKRDRATRYSSSFWEKRLMISASGSDGGAAGSGSLPMRVTWCSGGGARGPWGVSCARSGNPGKRIVPRRAAARRRVREVRQPQDGFAGLIVIWMRALRRRAVYCGLANHECNARRACGPRVTTRWTRTRKKRVLSATILTIRERRETSQTILRGGDGAGCRLPLLHAGCRGEAAHQRLREEPSRRPRRSVCHGHAGAAFTITRRARTRAALLERRRNTGGGRNAGVAV